MPRTRPIRRAASAAVAAALVTSASAQPLRTLHDPTPRTTPTPNLATANNAQAQRYTETDERAQRKARAHIRQFLAAPDATAEQRAADNLIGMLDSQAFRVRRAAAAELARSTLTSDRLLSLAASGTTDQAAALLIDTARERFYEEPRAALGINMSVPVATNAPTIAALIDGFPAQRDGTLKPGDRIVSLAGINTKGDTQFNIALRAAIQSHRPGDTAKITVERPIAPEGAPPPRPLTDFESRQIRAGAEPIPWWLDPATPRSRTTTTVTFGGYDDLNQARVSQTVLDRAWRILLDRRNTPDAGITRITEGSRTGDARRTPKPLADTNPTADRKTRPVPSPNAETRRFDESPPESRRARTARTPNIPDARGILSEQGPVTGWLTLARRVGPDAALQTVRRFPALDPAAAARAAADAATEWRALARRLAAAQADAPQRAERLAPLAADAERRHAETRSAAADAADRAADPPN